MYTLCKWQSLDFGFVRGKNVLNDLNIIGLYELICELLKFCCMVPLTGWIAGRTDSVRQGRRDRGVL